MLFLLLHWSSCYSGVDQIQCGEHQNQPVNKTCIFLSLPYFVGQKECVHERIGVFIIIGQKWNKWQFTCRNLCVWRQLLFQGLGQKKYMKKHVNNNRRVFWFWVKYPDSRVFRPFVFRAITTSDFFTLQTSNFHDFMLHIRLILKSFTPCLFSRLAKRKTAKTLA